MVTLAATAALAASATGPVMASVDGPLPTSLDGAVVYVSSTTGGSADGLPFADEDILGFDVSTGTWSMVFDGSDVNVGDGDVDGFDIVSVDPLVIDLSFEAPRSLPGLGTVDDSDVVTFSGVGGPDTSGSFARRFDGSDVGLTTDGEDVDAVGMSGGDSVLSTAGSFAVTGASGADEDLVRFTPTSTGSDTAGAFDVLFDGSDVGLGPRDLTGVAIDSAAGVIYGAALNSWVLAGVAGDADDIFAFSGVTGPDTDGVATIVFDGDAAGYANEQIDGLDIVAGVAESGEADLSVAIDDDPDLALPGGQVTFTITVANAGPDEAVGVIVDTTLPAGLSLLSTAGCLQDPVGDPCSLDAIGPGGSAQFTLVAAVDAGAAGPVTTSVEVASTLADPDIDNNSTSIDTGVATAPTANDDGPAPGSVPGDAFHALRDTTLTVAPGSAQDLLANDMLGDPAASIVSFGGGSLGQSVTDNAAGTNVSYGDGGSLVVDADGGLSFTPETGFAGSFEFEYRLANPAGVSDATVTILVGEATPPENLLIYLSSTTAGTVGGVSFADEDILRHHTATGTWSMVFDGSDVGVGANDLDGFHVHSVDPLVVDLSFGTARNLPGLGTVDDSDIVRFSGVGGPDTAGSFELIIDGSDVGLTRDAEDIDAIGYDGRYLVSSVGNLAALAISAADEDLVAFTPSSTGANTAGSFEPFLDGSDIGLAPRDLTGASVADGVIYGAALNSWTIDGTAGDADDVFAYTGTTGPDTAGTATIVFDGDESGFANEQIDGLHVVEGPPVNDDFADRLAAVEGVNTGTNVKATLEPGEPVPSLDNGVGASVWWDWVAPSDGIVDIATAGSSFDTVLGIWTGDTVGTLNAVTADDDGGPGRSSQVHFRAVAGTAYRVAVYGYGAAQGDIEFTLEFQPAAIPVNDDFVDAIELTGGGAAGNNNGATLEAGEPIPDGFEFFDVDGSVWWSWTAPTDGTFVIDTAGSSSPRNPPVAVWQGSDLASIDLLASSGSLGEGFLQFDAAAGDELHIAVYRAPDREGGVRVNVRANLPQREPVLDLFGEDAALALDGSGYPVLFTGEVLVHCNDADCLGDDEAINPIGEGFYFSYGLALDAAGTPIIAAGNGYQVTVVNCNDPDCAGDDETVNSFAPDDVEISDGALELDPSGNPVLLLSQTSPSPFFDFEDILLVRCDEPDCAGGDDPVNLLASAIPSPTGVPLSLAVAASGNPTLLREPAVTVATCDDPLCDGPGSLAGEPSQLVPVDGVPSSIVLDPAGKPVIGFSTSGGPGVIRCNDPACAGDDDTVAVIPTPYQARDVLADVDTDGNPVVAWIDTGAGNLVRIARCLDPSCTAPPLIVDVDYEPEWTTLDGLEVDPVSNGVTIAYRTAFEVKVFRLPGTP